MEQVEVVQKDFRVVGLSLPLDGSEDIEISVKGLATEFLKAGQGNWGIVHEVETEDQELEEEDDEQNFSYD